MEQQQCKHKHWPVSLAQASSVCVFVSCRENKISLIFTFQISDQNWKYFEIIIIIAVWLGCGLEEEKEEMKKLIWNIFQFFNCSRSKIFIVSVKPRQPVVVAVIQLNLKLEQTSNYISESVTGLNMLPQSAAIRKILDWFNAFYLYPRNIWPSE